MNKYDKRHIQNLAKYERQIQALFEAATQDAANLAPLIGVLGDAPFAWEDYPLALAQMNRIIEQLNSDVTTSIVNGVRSEWTLSNNKNNELCNVVFGSLATSLPEAAARRYYSTNEYARDAFLARKERGLGLSDNVWRYTNQFKGEVEMALDLGIRSGRSADGISRDLRDYLKYPDKLFRRVRDKHGQLHLSKRAAEFHPGRGVYRSSYMNARRLAATETNIAYRTADHLRWQQLDFVVGIEIHLSNNHNCKGVPAGAYYDICDELKGKYPKDFKFLGWHPHCRCYATSILKTEEEMEADNARIMAGKEPSEGGQNEVRELPKNFTDWVANNADRIEAAAQRGNTPYFLRDNMQRVNDIINDPAGAATTTTRGVGINWENIIRQLDDDDLEEYTYEMFDNARERRAFVRANEGKLADRVVDYIKQQQDPEYPDYLQSEFNIYRAMQKTMNLPDDFEELFADYMSGYYKQFNEALRRGESPAHSKLMKTLDEATRNNRLPANLILHRYVGNDFIAINFGVNSNMTTDEIVTLINANIGKRIVDNAFVSTSAISQNNVMSHMECKLKILAPKGSQGCVTNNITESEILLPRGQAFEVLGARPYMSSQGNLCVEVTFLLR